MLPFVECWVEQLQREVNCRMKGRPKADNKSFINNRTIWVVCLIWTHEEVLQKSSELRLATCITETMPNDDLNVCVAFNVDLSSMLSLNTTLNALQ